MADRHRLLEPGIFEVYGGHFRDDADGDRTAAVISIAISLKRIADALEDPEMPEEPLYDE